MKNSDISKSIEERSLVWTSGETLEEFLNLILLSLPIGSITYVFLEYLDVYYTLPMTILLCSTFILVLIKYKVRSRRLIKVEHNLNEDEVKALIKAISIDNEWGLLNNNKKYALLRKSVMWQWEGFRITILKQKSTIWINSMIEPSMRSNPFGDRVNRNNVRAILDHVELAKQGVDFLEVAKTRAEQRRINEIESPEWRGKNLAMRIIILPLLISFMGIGVIGLYYDGIAALPVFVLLWSIALTYIYVDIRAIMYKNNNKDRS